MFGIKRPKLSKHCNGYCNQWIQSNFNFVSEILSISLNFDTPFRIEVKQLVDCSSKIQNRRDRYINYSVRHYLLEFKMTYAMKELPNL